MQNIIDKATKVIESCKTREQYKIARNYCELVEKQIGFNAFMVTGGLYDQLDNKWIEIITTPITPPYLGI